MPAVRKSAVAQSQFARFASVCRTFAPIYRQMTLGRGGGLRCRRGRNGRGDARLRRRASPHGAIISPTSNNGRPFVLIGHSQGSLMLQS